MDYKEIGNSLFKQSKWKEAKESYTKALELDPEMTAALANRAACLIHLHEYRDALRDCEEALISATGNLRTKVIWRQAVCLRKLGSDEERWKSVVDEGLALDRDNGKLLEERSFIFVRKVTSMPSEYFSENHAETNPAPKAQTEDSAPSRMDRTLKSSTMTLPKLPLTYHGLLRLIRMKTPESVKFWYDKLYGTDLQAVLKNAGLEPDTLDYITKLIVENPGQPKNAEFLEALQKSPRFETALFMADEATYQKAVVVSRQT